VRFLAIDYGSKRLGIAITDPSGQIVSKTLVIENKPSLIDDLKALFVQYPEIGEIIIGLPKDLSGKEGIAAGNVREFAQKLTAVTPIVPIFRDERLTTKLVTGQMISHDVSRKDRKSHIDESVAALLLSEHIEAKRKC
jgi:putative Holliday junction resolvase